jgi:superfamily II DNA/RNA helicase
MGASIILPWGPPPVSSFHDCPSLLSTAASAALAVPTGSLLRSATANVAVPPSPPSISPDVLKHMRTAWPRGLSDRTLEALFEQGFKKPTKTQADFIPSILKGENVLMGAATGTGKTIAYVAPILQALKEAEAEHLSAVGGATTVTRRKRPRALILAPTRELCTQILDVVKRLSHVLKLRSLLIVGGTKQGPQRQALDTPVDVVVATPGRLALLHQQGHVHLTDCKHVVVDEVDTMLSNQTYTSRKASVKSNHARHVKEGGSFGDELAEVLKRLRLREQSAEAAAKYEERKKKEKLLGLQAVKDSPGAIALDLSEKTAKKMAAESKAEDEEEDIDTTVARSKSSIQYVLVGATIPQGMAKKLASMIPAAKDAVMKAQGGAGAANQLQGRQTVGGEKEKYFPVAPAVASPSEVASSPSVAVASAGGAASLHIIPRNIQQEFRRVGGGPNAKHSALSEVLSELLLMREGEAEGTDNSFEVVPVAGDDGTPIKRKKSKKSKSIAAPGSQIIIFCNSVAAARSTAYFVAEQGYSAACLHGEIPPDRRAQEYELFRSGKVPLLICTDAAARGLDFPSAGTVIMFDFPKSAVDYVHRAGRVGRAGSLTPSAATATTGEDKAPFAFRCISLCGPKDEYLSRGIEKAAQKGLPIDPNQSPVPPTAPEIPKRRGKDDNDRRGRGRKAPAAGGSEGSPRLRLRKLNERAPSIVRRESEGDEREGRRDRREEPSRSSSSRPSSSGRGRPSSTRKGRGRAGSSSRGRR